MTGCNPFYIPSSCHPVILSSRHPGIPSAHAPLHHLHQLLRIERLAHGGKGGDIATNRREDQELAVLTLHLLQNALVYINTLMLQRVLGEAAWVTRLTVEDLRAFVCAEFDVQRRKFAEQIALPLMERVKQGTCLRGLGFKRLDEAGRGLDRPGYR